MHTVSGRDQRANGNLERLGCWDCEPGANVSEPLRPAQIAHPQHRGCSADGHQIWLTSRCRVEINPHFTTEERTIVPSSSLLSRSAGLLGAVAVLCFGLAATASAHEFVASKVGTIVGKTTARVVFHDSAGTFECEEGTDKGTVSALTFSAFKAVVSYPRSKSASCSYFGALMKFTSSAEYEYAASGTAALLNTYIAEVPKLECEFDFTPGSAEKTTVTYTNSAPIKSVEAHRVTEGQGITAIGGGGSCGPVGKKENTLKVEETTRFELEGGTLQYK